MNQTTYVVPIRVTQLGGDLPGLFDMMRYEGATLVSWEHEQVISPGVTRFNVTLRSERFTPDRWMSFALYPRVTS